MTSGRIITVETREGTTLYSDKDGREGLRVISHLSVTMVEAEVPPGHPPATQVVWCQHGTFGATVEALAQFYLHNPGAKDAVDGMFLSLAKKRTGTL